MRTLCCVTLPRPPDVPRRELKTKRTLTTPLCPQILEEVERRREISPPLVYTFMRSVMEAPFPAPGRTVTVKSFLPGSGNEVSQPEPGGETKPLLPPADPG